jgi:putative transport protein
LQRGDGLLIAADTAAAIDETAALLGRLDPGRIAKDRADVSYQRFFVSNWNLCGLPLSDLPIPSGVPMRIVHIRRYDVDLVPSPDLMPGAWRSRRRPRRQRRCRQGALALR